MNRFSYHVILKMLLSSVSSIGMGVSNEMDDILIFKYKNILASIIIPSKYITVNISYLDINQYLKKNITADFKVFGVVKSEESIQSLYDDIDSVIPDGLYLINPRLFNKVKTHFATDGCKVESFSFDFITIEGLNVMEKMVYGEHKLDVSYYNFKKYTYDLISQRLFSKSLSDVYSQLKESVDTDKLEDIYSLFDILINNNVYVYKKIYNKTEFKETYSYRFNKKDNLTMDEFKSDMNKYFVLIDNTLMSKLFKSNIKTYNKEGINLVIVDRGDNLYMNGFAPRLNRIIF